MSEFERFTSPQFQFPIWARRGSVSDNLRFVAAVCDQVVFSWSASGAAKITGIEDDNKNSVYFVFIESTDPDDEELERYIQEAIDVLRLGSVTVEVVIKDRAEGTPTPNP
jgi:hypothetical protein